MALTPNRVVEEITISTESDSYLAIESDVHTLRKLAFKNSASEEFYHEILSRPHTANTDLQQAQIAINKMREEWEKMAKFISLKVSSKKYRPPHWETQSTTNILLYWRCMSSESSIMPT